jgi:hypothetical protein
MGQNTFGKLQRMASRFTEDLVDDLEPWKTDHDTAMMCLDLEDRMPILNGVLGGLLRMETRRHAAILSGRCRIDHDVERRLRESLGTVLKSCARVLAAVDFLEGKDYPVEGASKFRNYQRMIQEVVLDMDRREQVARRVGLSGVILDEQAVGLMDRMMNDPSCPSPHSTQGPLGVPITGSADPPHSDT